MPKQLVIKKDGSSISDAVAKSGLTLPLGMNMFPLLESKYLKHAIVALDNVAKFLSYSNFMHRLHQ